MPILYYIHFKKEFMLQGEAFDFLKHLYATRRASTQFPRLHFRVHPEHPILDPPEVQRTMREGVSFGTGVEAQERYKAELIRAEAMVELCEANFKMFQRKYEKLHRSPAAHIWAKKYLTKTSKKMSEPVKRDNTVYFKAEHGEDDRFDLDEDDLAPEEINFAQIRWRRVHLDDVGEEVIADNEDIE